MKVLAGYRFNSLHRNSLFRKFLRVSPEARLKRPVFTHEFQQLSKEIKEAFKQDFMNLVHSEHNLELEHVKQSRDLFTKHISKF